MIGNYIIWYVITIISDKMISNNAMISYIHNITMILSNATKWYNLIWYSLTLHNMI